MPNSKFDYAIDNVLLVCFVLGFVSILLSSCFDKEECLLNGG